MTLRRELKAYRLILRDHRTPKTVKLLLALAVVYLLFPFDLIPDFVPLIGHLDDIIIVPAALVLAARKMIPKEVVEECRIQAEKQGG